MTQNCAGISRCPYDPAADPGTVRREVEQLSRNDFVQLLQQGCSTQTQIAEIADQLGSRSVLTTVRAAEREAVRPPAPSGELSARYQ